MTALDATLHALADPERRRLLEALLRGTRRPHALADSLGLSRPATSRHLAVLREAGLVEVAPGADDARAREYAVRPERLRALRDWLDEAVGYWQGQLAAFAAHAEREP